MTGPAANVEKWVSRFASCEAELAERGPTWLPAVRRAAIEHFATLGFPTRKWEAWKYTSAAPIAAAGLDLAPRPDETDNSANRTSHEDIRELFGAEAAECGLVFENGAFSSRLSAPSALAEGVSARGLAEVMAVEPERARRFVDSRVAAAERPFAALNCAFQQGGAFVEVAAGATPPRPIHLLFVTSSEAAGGMAHPRNVIAIGAGARATVILRYASLCDDIYLTNAMTQVTLAPNAELDLITLQSESERAYHLASLDVTQDRDSRFHSHLISLGAALARIEINTRLAGPGAACALNGLFMAGGRQHVDNQTTIDHSSPHGTSRELYKGLLDGRSRGVFNGLIIVRPGAQKTNAQQSNPNLLISDRAQVNTKPTLEIYADDVKCNHGSTIGRIDEDAIFYLRSRGLEEQTARRILTGAFASEIARVIPDEPLREETLQLIDRKLAFDQSEQEAA